MASVSTISRSWEDVCDRCGLCCADKLRLGSRILYQHRMCEFYKEGTGCTVYPVRQIMKPNCVELTPWNVPEWLPDTCAYRNLDLKELERFQRG